jgi:hypothetical protein
LAPSPALAGALTLALFGGRRAIGWDEKPILASTIPARIATVGGPPPGLVERVRHLGEAHRGYIEYATIGRRSRRRSEGEAQ